MTNTLRSLDPPINTVPDGGPYAGRHRLLNSTVVVQPRVRACCAAAAGGMDVSSSPQPGAVPALPPQAMHPSHPTRLRLQGTFFVPCQYNQADCHRKMVTERALGVASLSHLAGEPQPLLPASALRTVPRHAPCLCLHGSGLLETV